MLVRFKYQNKTILGTSNFPEKMVQVKEIISHEIFLSLVKPSKEKLASLDSILDKDDRTKHRLKTLASMLERNKASAKKMTDAELKKVRDEMNNLSKERKLSDEEIKIMNDEIVVLKDILKPYKGDWCTDQSPLGLSLKDNVLRLPEHQGGERIIEFEILEE